MKKIALILLLISLNVLYAGDRSFTIYVDLTEKAINKALQKQYDQVGFPKVVSGSVSGVTYTINLTRPFVDFEPGNVKLVMEVNVTSSVGNYNGIIMTPNLSIPSSSISASQVKAYLTNLSSKIQALDVPSWLKTALTNAYNSYEPWVYPSKLLDSINDADFLQQRRINITDLTLGWSVQSDKLVLSITTEANSAFPYMSVAMSVDGTSASDYLLVNSNIEVKVVRAVIRVSGTGIMVYNGEPNATCPKANAISINIGNISSYTNYDLIVTYETDDTFYIREYAFVPYYYAGGFYGHVGKFNE